MVKSLTAPPTKKSISSIFDSSEIKDIVGQSMDMSSSSIKSALPVLDTLDDDFLLAKSIASESNTNSMAAVNCSLQSIDLNLSGAVETEKTNETDDLVNIIMDESCRTKVDTTVYDEAYFAPWDISNSSVESYLIPISPLGSSTSNLPQSPFNEINTDWTQPFDNSDFSKL